MHKILTCHLICSYNFVWIHRTNIPRPTSTHTQPQVVCFLNFLNILKHNNHLQMQVWPYTIIPRYLYTIRIILSFSFHYHAITSLKVSYATGTVFIWKKYLPNNELGALFIIFFWKILSQQARITCRHFYLCHELTTKIILLKISF